MARILIRDQNDGTSEALVSTLQNTGHKASLAQSSEGVAEALVQNPADVLLLDMAAGAQDLPETVKAVRSIRGDYTYICLLSDEMSGEEAVQAGANNILPAKPDETALTQIIENAEFLKSLAGRIGDESEDFPSAGGVIARSAFNQLFLSAIDRANRYGEQTYIIFFEIKNYRELLELDGPYAADYAVAMLSRHLVNLRRQSDIIGQTAKSEYALLLQRPSYENEPVEAAQRLSKALDEFDDISKEAGGKVDISVSLVALPAGVQMMDQSLTV